ncbi:hypothetical protein LUZ60_011384 [Juncus effusus]|nr:hypothetical protein LUZ60_011384 [Juncus effusus]
MAGRRGPHVLDLDQSRAPLLGRAPPPPPNDPYLRHHHLPPPHHSTGSISALEDRLAAIDREIHSLLVDNQRLAAVHVALRQELLKSQHELRVSAATASGVRADKEAELREVMERAMHAEAAARQVDGVKMEIVRVCEDVKKLTAVRDEMVERLVGMRGELGRMKAENGRMEMVGKEIDAMQREIQKGRAAIEFEKKAHAENLEQSKQMESNMVSMAREIEKLRSELGNVGKKIVAANATNPGYAGAYGNSAEVNYGGVSHADAYHQAQVQNAAATITQPPTAYNTQQIHPQR